MGWLAIPAGIYYSDVYPQYPAAILFLLAAAAVLLPDSTAEDATPSVAVPQDERAAYGRPGYWTHG